MAQPNECVPDIQVQEVMVGVPAELTQAQNNPAIPSHGDNATLLEWCLACAATTRKLNSQLEAIRALK